MALPEVETRQPVRHALDLTGFSATRVDHASVSGLVQGRSWLQGDLPGLGYPTETRIPVYGFWYHHGGLEPLSHQVPEGSFIIYDRASVLSNSKEIKMTTSASIQLMYFGNAKQAMDLYTTTFKNSGIDEVTYDSAGLVQRAKFHIENQTFYCIDSMEDHKFTFTPSFSIFIDFDEEDELMRVLEVLSKGGNTFMALDNYGFSRKFTWISDAFGVSWQLNLK
jgi:predicted 3-demethylubiquinone-9 3-methyltransferase (glyoxalase superfamily)